jgi:hypothetical protein
MSRKVSGFGCQTRSTECRVISVDGQVFPSTPDPRPSHPYSDPLTWRERLQLVFNRQSADEVEKQPVPYVGPRVRVVLHFFSVILSGPH